MKKVRQKLLCRIKGNTVCLRVHGGFFWPSPDCLLTQPRTVQITAELATFSSRVIQSWFPKRDEEGTQKGGDRERNATRRQRNQFSGWKQTEREVWPRLGSVNSASPASTGCPSNLSAEASWRDWISPRAPFATYSTISRREITGRSISHRWEL